MNAINPFKINSFDKSLSSISIVCLLVSLVSCGGGGSGGDSTLFTIGGTVSGLTGSVVLQNNGGNSLTVNTDGGFTFTTSLADSGAYQVTVSTHPAGQACSVSNGNGTLSAANVSNIAVICIVFTAPPTTAVVPTLGFDIKTFRFTWADVSDATFYRLMENPDGASGFTQVSGDIAQGTQSYDHGVSLYQRAGASYFLQSCNSVGCTDGATISSAGTLVAAIGYFKASNTKASSTIADEFGLDVALSADGNTLAVGARHEASNSDVINAGENDVTAPSAGAVYVYTNNSGSWSQQAYIKADNSASGDEFGTAVSLSDDGNILAVGAPQQGSTGSVYVFARNGNNWSQQPMLKAVVTGADLFGDAVSLSGNGSTLAVGAKAEDNPNTGIAAVDNAAGAASVGAAYIFTVNTAGTWAQQVYIKADNADGGDSFGSSVSLSADGNTFVVGAPGEGSNTVGTSVDTGMANNMAAASGAAYVYTRNGAGMWSLESYLKASNTGAGDNFGVSISLSDNGNTLAVGAPFEDSMAVGIDGAQMDEGALTAGAAYIFTRTNMITNMIWSQQSYIKASNTGVGDNFGRSVSLSASGDALVVSADKEQGNAVGLGGDETNNAFANGAGAAYVFARNSGVWSQQSYVKASNTEEGDIYGAAVELSGDGGTLAVGASLEDSNATGIGGDATNNSSLGAGAVYLY